MPTWPGCGTFGDDVRCLSGVVGRLDLAGQTPTRRADAPALRDPMARWAASKGTTGPFPSQRPAHEARGVAGRGLRRVRCRFAGSVDPARCMRGLRSGPGWRRSARAGGGEGQVPPGAVAPRGHRLRTPRGVSHPVGTDCAPRGVSRTRWAPTAHPAGCLAPGGHRLRTPWVSPPRGHRLRTPRGVPVRGVRGVVAGWRSGLTATRRGGRGRRTVVDSDPTWRTWAGDGRGVIAGGSSRLLSR